jgi:hypothetical protein
MAGLRRRKLAERGSRPLARMGTGRQAFRDRHHVVSHRGRSLYGLHFHRSPSARIRRGCCRLLCGTVHNRHLSNSFSGFSSALARLPQARLHHSRRFRARPLWQSLACSRDHRHRHRCDHAVYCASARWYSGRSRRAWNFRNRTRERLAAHHSLRHPGGLHLFEWIASTCFDRNCEGYPDLHHRLRCDYRRSYPAGWVCKNLFGHS